MTTATKNAAPSAEVRRRDPEATRAAILDAAEELFVDLGPGATSMAEVGRHAGVTKSLIHHHFGSKEELWLEVRRRHFQRYHAIQLEMLKGSSGGLELLRDSTVAFFRYLQSDPRAVRFLTWRAIEEQDPCLDLEDELFEVGFERIRQAQEAGEMRSDVEPMSVVKVFLGMVSNWFQTKDFLCEIMGPDCDGESLDEKFLADAVTILTEGVRPR